MKNVWVLFVSCCLSLAAASVLAQDVQTKGFIGGTVTDAAGAAVPGAKVTITGQTGERTGTTSAALASIQSLADRLTFPMVFPTGSRTR